MNLPRIAVTVILFAAVAAPPLVEAQSPPVSTTTATAPTSVTLVAEAVQRRLAQQDKRVQALLAVLDDPDTAVRTAALEALAELRDVRVIDPLRKLLSHWDRDVRRSAIEIIGRFDDDSASKALVDALNDPEPYVVSSALAKLRERATGKAEQSLLDAYGSREDVSDLLSLVRRKDKASVSKLAEALKGSAVRRRGAATALAEIDTPESRDALVKALESEDWRIRYAVLHAMAETKRPDVQAVLKLCQDQSSAVRLEVISVLEAAATRRRPHLRGSRTIGGGGEPALDEEALACLGRMVADPEPYLRKQALSLLVLSAGDGELGDLLLVLLDDPDSKMREMARTSLLGQVQPRHAETLRRLAVGKDCDLAKAAAEAIAEMDAPAALEDQAWLLTQEFARTFAGEKESLAHIRQRAVFRIGQAKHPSAIVVLLKMLDDTDAEIRSEAADYLRQYVFDGRDKALRTRVAIALAERIADKDPHVRYAALTGLWELPRDKAVPLLLKAVGDTDLNVRTTAAIQLGQLRVPEGAEPIGRELMKAKSDEAESYARALLAIGTPEAVGLVAKGFSRLDRNDQDRMLPELLATRNPPASLADRALEALESRNDTLRQEAAKALGRMGEPRSIGPLEKVAVNAEEPQAVRAAAVVGLAWLDGKKAKKLFIDIRGLGFDPLAKAVQDRTEEQLIPALLAVMASGNSEVARPAMHRLVQIGHPSAIELIQQQYRKPGADRKTLGWAIRTLGGEVPKIPAATKPTRKPPASSSATAP